MGFPATRKPCDIALQGQTLLVFVFGITPPPHRPDAAVKAELIPTRPSASACSSVVSTPSSRSCVSSPKQQSASRCPDRESTRQRDAISTCSSRLPAASRCRRTRRLDLIGGPPRATPALLLMEKTAVTSDCPFSSKAQPLAGFKQAPAEPVLPLVRQRAHLLLLLPLLERAPFRRAGGGTPNEEFRRNGATPPQHNTQKRLGTERPAVRRKSRCSRGEAEDANSRKCCGLL